MRLIRWTALLAAFCWRSMWLVGSLLPTLLANRWIADRCPARAALTSVPRNRVRGTDRSWFSVPLTDATYASETYGASVSTPGKTQAGVNLPIQPH